MAHPPAPFGIDLRDARVELCGKAVLADLTLTLTEARIGIVGRNGSGKTTLMRLIAGLIAPDNGEISVHGTDPMGDRRAMLGEVGILFQNPDRMILFPTVIEELAFGPRQMGRSDGEARKAALAALTAEGRAHWADAATHTLSQGQRHYLCLMSVLLMEPRTLLLDEPFAGMDLPTIQRMQRKLAGLPQQVITISHDPEAVAGSDRVIWIEAGRVVADGPADKTLAAFRAEMSRIGGMDADTDLPR
jgi:biotin transport system ATP-binding protein